MHKSEARTIIPPLTYRDGIWLLLRKEVNDMVSYDDSEIDPNAPRWLLPDMSLLPVGHVVFLHGQGGCNKTTLAVKMAAMVTSAKAEGRQHGEPVIFMSSEDGRDKLMAWMEASGGEPGLLLPLCAEQGDISLFREMDFFEKIIRKALGQSRPDFPLRQVRLIVIDPLLEIAPSGTNSNSHDDMGGMMGQLEQFAARNKVTIVVIGHDNKDPRSADTAYCGSQALYNRARQVIAVAKEKKTEGERIVFKVTKSNNGPAGINWSVPLRNMGPNSDFLVAEDFHKVESGTYEMVKSASDDGDVELDEDTNYVYEYLLRNGGAALQRDVVKMLSKTPGGRNPSNRANAVRRHKNDLGIDTFKLTGIFRGPSVWRLKSVCRTRWEAEELIFKRNPDLAARRTKRQ